MAAIWSELAIDIPFVVSGPHSLQMAACDRRMWKVYLESGFVS